MQAESNKERTDPSSEHSDMPPPQKKPLFRLITLVLSLLLWQLFSNCKDPYLLYPYIQLSTSTHMYMLCWLPTFRPIC